MQLNDITARVGERVTIPPQRAETAVTGTMQALGEQSDAKQFADLLELPKN